MQTDVPLEVYETNEGKVKIVGGTKSRVYNICDALKITKQFYFF